MTIDASLLKRHFATSIVAAASFLLLVKNVLQQTPFWQTAYDYGTIPVLNMMVAVYGFLLSVACVVAWFTAPTQERQLAKLLLVLPMFLYGMAAVLYMLMLILRFLFLR